MSRMIKIGLECDRGGDGDWKHVELEVKEGTTARQLFKDSQELIQNLDHEYYSSGDYIVRLNGECGVEGEYHLCDGDTVSFQYQKAPRLGFPKWYNYYYAHNKWYYHRNGARWYKAHNDHCGSSYLYEPGLSDEKVYIEISSLDGPFGRKIESYVPFTKPAKLEIKQWHA